MHFAAVDSIQVLPNRIRREFDEAAHQELMASIRTLGLMNPITVREMPDGTLALVAGERRLRAMRALIEAGEVIRAGGSVGLKGTVPFLYITELSEAGAIEAELDENIKRRDLTLVERIEARKRLFDLRSAQARAEGKTYTGEDMAKELQASGVADSSARAITRELAVAQFLDKPEVRKATTMKDAVKAAKRATEAFLVEALGESIEGTAPPTHIFHEGDTLDIITRLDSNRYDCVLTDPPYGIGIDDSGSMVEHTHHYDDGPDVLERILDRVPFHLYRITRQQAHVYWFCDLRWFAKISFALEEAGFSVCSYPIVWWKRGKAMAPDVTRWPKREYELIVYAIKGDKAPFKVAGDVISTSYTADLLQAEKPKELFVELLSRSVLAGSQVIDPFCGSGVIFDAAEELQCSATGIELDPARADFARIRSHGM